MRSPLPRSLILFALLGGAVAFGVSALGSVQVGLAAGILCLAVGMVALVWRSGPAPSGEPADPGRRRFLTLAGAGGFVWLVVGGALGRATRTLSLPDPRPIQEAMARGLGAEYMELVRRAYHPGRSGDLQLVLAPFNSSNYANESQDLSAFYRATSHASVWMYLERVPLLVHAPGRVDPADDTSRVTLADLAPTTATLMGFGDWPADRAGASLPGIIGRGEWPQILRELACELGADLVAGAVAAAAAGLHSPQPLGLRAGCDTIPIWASARELTDWRLRRQGWRKILVSAERRDMALLDDQEPIGMIGPGRLGRRLAGIIQRMQQRGAIGVSAHPPSLGRLADGSQHVLGHAPLQFRQRA